jgi:hypothetical protein
MPRRDDEKRRLLEQYRDNLAHLESQAALYGGEAFAPLSIVNSLKLTREEIARLEAALQAPNPDPNKAPEQPRSLPPVSAVVGALQLTVVLEKGCWVATVTNVGQQSLSSLRLKFERPSTLYINPEVLELPRLAAGAHFERGLTIASRGAIAEVQIPLVATYYPAGNPPRHQGTLTLVLPE